MSDILGNPNATWDDISCEFLKIIDSNNTDKRVCSLASQAQGSDIQARPYYCSICLECSEPKQLGNRGIRITTQKAIKAKHEKLYLSAEEKLGVGPGTELHKMIPKFLENPSCNCKSWAKKMNVWGVDGCKTNREAIINKLLSESNKKSLFNWVPDSAMRMVAAKLVDTAIARYETHEKSQTNKWTAVVTTAPRRDPTLSSCLDSMLIAGWNFQVFAEPGNYTFLNEEYRHKTIFHKERKGVWWNWIESCRWALENTDSNIIMTVQDDSVFHPDSKSMVEQFMWPAENVGFISLYTPKHYSTKMHLKSRPERPLGLNQIATKALWGSCALVWPRKVLEEVMQHELIEGWLGAPLKTKSAWKERQIQRAKEPWTIQNSDTAIGKIMNRMGRSMWFMDPSPVQHVAQYSAINHGGNKGRRNCGRCAKYSKPLAEQLPLHLNGKEDFDLIDYTDIKV